MTCVKVSNCKTGIGNGNKWLQHGSKYFEIEDFH
jgi:hypothetical protein